MTHSPSFPRRRESSRNIRRTIEPFLLSVLRPRSAGILGVGRCRMQLKSQRPDDAQSDRELGVAGRGKCLVKAFPSKPRFACELLHAFGPCNVAQRCSEKRGIVFFQGRFKIGRHVFIRLKVFSRVPEGGRRIGRFLDHFHSA